MSDTSKTKSMLKKHGLMTKSPPKKRPIVKLISSLLAWMIAIVIYGSIFQIWFGGNGDNETIGRQMKRLLVAIYAITAIWACMISWAVNGAFWWAVLHFFLGWWYIGYHFIVKQGMFM